MRCLKAPLCKGRYPEGGGRIEISLPYQGRWILPQAKDGEVFVSDVGALRKCASGTFLAKTAAAMPRGGKLFEAKLPPAATFFLRLQKECGKKSPPKRGAESPSLETPLSAKIETASCHIISV